MNYREDKRIYFSVNISPELLDQAGNALLGAPFLYA